MMNNNFNSLSMVALMMFTLSCNDRNTAELAPDYLYDAGNQKVIKSIINNKRGTVSILYGNETALQAAGNFVSDPNVGAHYTLVTWKQKPMPQWYGTAMNGEIYSVEKLHVLRQDFEYDFQTGKGHTQGDVQPEKEKRIQFILSQRAAVFP